MNETQQGSSTIFSLHGVRYQVTDVARAAAFYTDRLGFKLEHQQLPAFASVSLGDFMLLLSGPGASGSRPMPGGESQQPGGWNRVVLRVADLRPDRRRARSGTRKRDPPHPKAPVATRIAERRLGSSPERLHMRIVADTFVLRNQRSPERLDGSHDDPVARIRMRKARKDDRPQSDSVVDRNKVQERQSL
jgi:catechol 2,3-dioxygenase-like lactoylglutathione lyase family enzyme